MHVIRPTRRRIKNVSEKLRRINLKVEMHPQEDHPNLSVRPTEEVDLR